MVSLGGGGGETKTLSCIHGGGGAWGINRKLLLAKAVPNVNAEVTL